MFVYDRKRLYDAMTDTLDACEVEWGDDGIEKNLAVWEQNKAALVEVLRKHPQWSEEAMAILTTERVRERIDVNAVFDLCCKIDEMLWQKFGKRSFSNMMIFSGWAEPKLSENMVQRIKRRGETKREPVVGQKTTRFLRQFFLDLGIEADDKPFWNLFQQLADRINAERIVERPLVISVNPADYLTMSFGTNWASCHIINPDMANTQAGNAYSGCYKAGCLSYMGDESSIVTYTVRELPEDVQELPTVRRMTRQMFFVNTEEPCMLQSQLYPYTDDLAMIEARRKIVQGILAECLGIENSWHVLEEVKGFVRKSGSLQYDDYSYIRQNNITTSVPADWEWKGMDVYIGEKAYCLTCGERIYDHEHIHCEDCDEYWSYCCECDRGGARNEMYNIEGHWYCEHCSTFCEYHHRQEAYNDEEMVYVEDYGYICEEALEEGDFVQEYWSGWWYDSARMDCIVCRDGSCFLNEADAQRAGYVQCCACGKWRRQNSSYGCPCGVEECEVEEWKV